MREQHLWDTDPSFLKIENNNHNSDPSIKNYKGWQLQFFCCCFLKKVVEILHVVGIDA